MNIGFIGLGIMGSRMAANLLKNGVDLTIHNRSADKGADLVNSGAAWGDSPADIGTQADILITMLAHPEAVEESALGERGFLAQMKQDTLWIDCSTVHPSFSREMASAASARGIRFLGAPVAGSTTPAERGELAFFIGGDAADIEQAKPYLDMMGNRIVHVGEQGMGVALKLVVNYLLASSMAAFSEGLAFGQSLGLSEEMLFKALVGGPIVPPYLGSMQDKLDGTTDRLDFPLKWMQKDLQMVTTAAYESGAAMPIANSAKELYRLAMRHGYSDKDFSAVYHFLKESSD